MYFNDGSKYIGNFISGIPDKSEDDTKIDKTKCIKSCEIKKYIKNRKNRYSQGLIEKNNNI
jgi:hypothetical protein